MIQSMTGFSRLETQGNGGKIVWEVRSVNHRFLELNLRLPENFRYLEPEVRSQVKAVFNRGKVDLNLNYQPEDMHDTELKLNQIVIRQLSRTYEQLKKMSVDLQPIDSLALLKWPGVIQTQAPDLTILEKTIMDLLKNTLEAVVEVRIQEGISIKKYLNDRIKQAQKYTADIQQRIPIVNQNLRDKFTEKLAELEISAEANRLEQEIAFYLQRLDVSEELNRLKTHLMAVISELKKGGVCGRRLDFLMQECHREINTLGAKTLDIATTTLVVELKLLIEQMREQIQNIE